MYPNCLLCEKDGERSFGLGQLRATPVISSFYSSNGLTGHWLDDNEEQTQEMCGSLIWWPTSVTLIYCAIGQRSLTQVNLNWMTSFIFKYWALKTNYIELTRSIFFCSDLLKTYFQSWRSFNPLWHHTTLHCATV